MPDTPRIQEISEGERIDSFFAVQDASLLTTAAGKPYIRLTLMDATGKVQANMWDGNEDIYASFTVGDVIKVRAQVETYRGSIQLKISNLRPALDSEVDLAAFVPTTNADVDALDQELDRLIASVTDGDYNTLLHTFFDDSEVRTAFVRSPAAKENHHGYVGGLLEHTVNLTRIAEVFCATTTTPLDRDLLLTGALLHDIGKIRELSVHTAIEYTDEGKLVGHLVIGALMVAERAAGIKNFPEDKKWLVQHLVLSHHGLREYGSPVLPATPEALALHHIDNLDAKTVAAVRLIDADTNERSRWTARSWMLDTALYKGSGEESNRAELSDAAGQSELTFGD